MEKYILLLGFLFFGLIQPMDVHAQDTSLYRIVTDDGNTFIGTIVSENEVEVVLKTEKLGEMTFRRDNIKTIEKVDSDRIKDGVYWFENPHSTRYLFSTSALGLKPGEGYYQNTWIFFNNVNVGITENISIGGGLVPMFLFGESATPIWIMPKVSIPIARDNLNFAAGGMFGGVVGDESFGMGLAYGLVTVGESDKNISLGMGYGYGNGEWSRKPFFNLSGMVRLNRNTYLVSENYLFSVGDYSTSIISAAVRWAPENFAVDFGLFRPLEEVAIVGIPWLGVTIPFGR